MEENKVKPGTVLLAEPFMMDSHFKRGVVLICESRPDGDVGFILNKPIHMNIQDLVGRFPEFDSDVYYGGPVATDTIHFLHNVGDLIEQSTEVARGVYWGGDFEKLKFLVESGLVKPHNVKFFVGYSGWSEGQLEEELEYGSWILDTMHPNYAFKDIKVDLWKKVMENKNDIYTVIAQLPDEPTYN